MLILPEEHIMSKTNIEFAIEYYNAMLAKDFNTMAGYLHDEAILISPLAKIEGKAAIVEAAKNLAQVLGKIDIRAKFSSENQVMLAYDFIFPTLDLDLPSAVLMSLSEDKIKVIELFYDPRPLLEKR